ncbi:MAG: vitamin B12 dependent-methionine synthase activation domain-containing protein, partial [Halochromatium sp.]
PSLDEMVHVAKEMQRQGMTQPLLIGGATTSKVHTAVKIAPQREEPVIYVPDASRAVGVVSNLLSKTQRDGYVAGIVEEYAEVRAKREAKGKTSKLMGLAEARANKTEIDWASYEPPRPAILAAGVEAGQGGDAVAAAPDVDHATATGADGDAAAAARSKVDMATGPSGDMAAILAAALPGLDAKDIQLERSGDGLILTIDDFPLDDLVHYIDWTPFFKAWELAGKYPAILTDEIVGKEAQQLFDDALPFLERVVEERWLKARCVCGFFPANRVGDDDIAIYSDETRSEVTATLHMLRQQMQRTAGKGQPNVSLADYVAPADSHKRDWVGAFAVTAGVGIDEHLERFEADHDDYSAIMLKALADRLAEAFAERLHQLVRTQLWGYKPGEQLDNDALIAEKYEGIRPAPGYAACPDHTEKGTLWELLKPDQRIGLTLTESFAMLPTAAVSGWYFAHPQSRYFGTGKIMKDQVEDYAQRKGWTLEQAERWLAPVLGYDPE